MNAYLQTNFFFFPEGFQPLSLVPVPGIVADGNCGYDCISRVVGISVPTVKLNLAIQFENKTHDPWVQEYLRTMTDGLTVPKIVSDLRKKDGCHAGFHAEALHFSFLSLMYKIGILIFWSEVSPISPVLATECVKDANLSVSVPQWLDEVFEHYCIIHFTSAKDPLTPRKRDHLVLLKEKQTKKMRWKFAKGMSFSITINGPGNRK